MGICDRNEQEIKVKLKEIEKEIESGFLKVNYKDSKGVHSAPITRTVVNDAKKKCLPGEATIGDNKCGKVTP